MHAITSQSWRPTEPLLRWNGWTSWTIGDSFEHAFAFGRTGSAKTSTLIEIVSKAALQAGYGCLFQTTKETDPDTCLKWIKEAGRSDSVVMIDSHRGLGCNLIKQELDYGASQGGKVEEEATESVVRLFEFIASLNGGTSNRRGDNSIWDLAARQLLRNALNLVYATTGTVTIDELNAVIRTAPQKPGDVDSEAWHRESRCGQLLTKAAELNPEPNSIKLAREYFLHHFPRLASETRTSILFSFSASWGDLLSRDPLRSLFFGQADYTMDILLEGAVIVVDLPTDEKSEIGRLANGLARWAAQRVLMRRQDLNQNRDSARPVAIVWDECQKTLCESDVSFQATARERRCMVLAASQTIGFMRAPIGSDLGEGFIANFNTKVFYQNQDPETNEFMARTIGKIWVKKVTSESRDEKGKLRKTKSLVEEDAFPAQDAQRLLSGGEKWDWRVSSILTQGGQQFRRLPWHRKKQGMIVTFTQGVWGWNWISMLSRDTGVCVKPRTAPDFRHLR